MSDDLPVPLDAAESPVPEADHPEREPRPTPRIGEPATEAPQESMGRSRAAVGEDRGDGGLTLADDAPERSERPDLGAPLGSTTGQVPPTR
jgi:hypothetical protein